MSSLIEQYEALHNQVKARAVYINDMLAELKLPEHLQNFSTPYCGSTAEDLNMEVGDNRITLSYLPPFEDYEDEWHINKDYIDMRDSAVIDVHFKYLESCYQKEKQHDLERLKREANLYGMMLVPNEDGGAA